MTHDEMVLCAVLATVVVSTVPVYWLDQAVQRYTRTGRWRR